MDRESVNSSNLKSVGYDEATQILEIEFNTRKIYQYHRVPKEVYNGLMTSPSHGQYFHRFIKDKFYTTKIG